MHARPASPRPRRVSARPPRGGARLLALIVLIGGCLASVLAAASVASGIARQSRTDFHARALQIGTQLSLAVTREDDLVNSVGAYVRQFPHLTQAQFSRWITGLDALQRYPELLGVAYINRVPAADLGAWEAAVEAQRPAGHPLALAIIGKRPFYCLPTATVVNPAMRAAPALDYCQIDPSGVRTIDAGQPSVYGLTLPYVGDTFGVFAPIYATSTTPRTVAARRAQFLGWIGAAFEPQVLLGAALAGHPHMRVELARVDGSELAISRGSAPVGAASTLVRGADDDDVRVYGAVRSAAIFAHSASIDTLTGGVLVSLLLAILLAVLATGRSRALNLVRQKTEQLSFQALHDSLTGLPNRLLVLDRLEHELSRARRLGKPTAALFIDVDGFKQVNDTCGHAAGDELLRVVAARLTSVVRDADTAGRLGGDEFMVLLGPGEFYVAPELVAERILEVLRAPITVEGQSVNVSASIGIATGIDQDAEELVRRADLALYAAKSAGKDRSAMFEDSMHMAAADRFELESDLRRAVANDELRLVYQPCFDLASRGIIGTEALVRWEHPTRGLIPPDQFIPLAEETGAIVEIGSWVMREACAQTTTWHEAGHPVGISVNVSPRQIEADDFLATVSEILEETGLDPSRLTLEVTETAIMRDVDRSAERLEVLKGLGVRIAIDDFGTGYSSMAYLRRLPIDSLKIDRSFISGIGDSDGALAMMRTLVQLGRQLGLETHGEGIEDSTQLERLRAANCDSGQGFLLARPLSAEQVGERLGQLVSATV